MKLLPCPFGRALPLLVSLGAPLHAGEVKVDINRDFKNLESVTEVGYVKWSQDTTGGASSGLTPGTKSFTSATGETVTVSFAQTALSQSRGGTGLLGNWYQTGAQGTARLVSGGLTVAPANFGAGGEMVMTITGLSAGAHTAASRVSRRGRLRAIRARRTPMPRATGSPAPPRSTPLSARRSSCPALASC